MLPPITENIEIPEGVTVEIVGAVLKAKGAKGENEKIFAHPKVEISKNESAVVVAAKRPNKKDKAMLYSFKAHIKNLLKGVNEGFVYKVKVCSSHFPMSVTVENDFIVIKNFLGEKIPRKSKIVPETSVKVEGDMLIIEGVDKEKISLTASRVEQSTRITNKDRRVFQDGCFITEKAGKSI